MFPGLDFGNWDDWNPSVFVRHVLGIEVRNELYLRFDKLIVQVQKIGISRGKNVFHGSILRVDWPKNSQFYGPVTQWKRKGPEGSAPGGQHPTRSFSTPQGPSAPHKVYNAQWGQHSMRAAPHEGRVLGIQWVHLTTGALGIIFYGVLGVTFTARWIQYWHITRQYNSQVQLNHG